ncbi:HAD-like protein, partial [Ramicandelaber brevisporus]
LCFMGMYAIVDPPRPDIEKVIATCRGAGVRIFMVTGDHALTAQSIARMIGIISPESTALVRDTKAGTKTALVMSGPELVGLTDEQWAVVTEYDEIVFARTTPAQKLEIVERMQKRGNVVGVTGDGVNDAPALKTADIGIAMGGGSDVAVEASAMVLLDNNFGSMVEAIRNGRLVFDNLQKVILYLLPAGSFSELIPTLFAFLLGCPMLLSPFLMIVICVFTDMISSIALMYEKPEANLLQRKPRNPRQTRLASAKLILHAYFFTGVLECLFASCMFFVYMYRYHAIKPNQIFLAYNNWNADWNHAVNVGQCVYFVSLIMTQCFGNLQCIRARYVPLWRHPMNWAVIASTVSTVVIALFVMYAPFMNKAFGTAAIPAEFWFFPVAFSVLLVAANEVLKWNRRTNDNFLTRYWW